MSATTCGRSWTDARLYASLRALLTSPAASGPIRPFLIKGRPTRSICVPSIGRGGIPEVLRRSPFCLVRGLWTPAHTASTLPPVATTSRSIEITRDEHFQPARKFVAGPPSVCSQRSRIVRTIASLKPGHPAASKAAPPLSAADAASKADLVPFTLLKNGSLRSPAKARNRRFRPSRPAALLSAPLT